jgi:tRNA(fMet)-specific endonuclease VapC
MYLTDTDIFIFALRGDQNIASRLSRHLAEPRALSVVTYGELLCGAMKSNQPIEGLAKVHRIATLYPIVDVSPAIVELFALQRVQLEEQGQRLEDFDLLIAATALHLNFTLVTGNTRYFERIPGLRIENGAA